MEYPPIKYSQKERLANDIAEAIGAAIHMQPRSPTTSEIKQRVEAELSTWACHPIPPHNGDKETLTDKVETLFREMVDAIVAQHAEYAAKADQRLIGVAKALCQQDIGADQSVDQVVMGQRDRILCVTGKDKRLACLMYPLQPAWMHYISDAMTALAAVERYEEEKTRK